MIQLKFDVHAMFNDMVSMILIPAANESMKRVYDDIQHGLSHPIGAPYSKRHSEESDVHRRIAKIDAARDFIVASCVSYGWALVESYGTGVKLDLNNDELAEYIGSSLWNPLRHGFPIVGRAAGEYTNFFGENTESPGKQAGKSMGKWGQGRKPGYAIQNAEKRLRESGLVERLLDSYTEEFFDKIDTTKYFYEVNV